MPNDENYLQKERYLMIYLHEIYRIDKSIDIETINSGQEPRKKSNGE